MEVLSDEIEQIETGAAYEAAERFEQTPNVTDAATVLKFFSTRVPGPLGRVLSNIPHYYFHEATGGGKSKK